jgi:hypothetical protein
MKRDFGKFSVTEIVSTIQRHYKEGNLNYPMILYISLAHIAAIVGILSIPYCHVYTLLWAFVLWPIT